MATINTNVREIECSGFCAPGAFDQTPSPTGPPDPETQRIMAAHDRYNDFKAVESSSDDPSSVIHRAAVAEQVVAQRELIERLKRERASISDEGPEPGASYDDRRVYTHTQEGGYKYWGVREPGTTREEFWAKHDANNSRNQVHSPDNEEKRQSSSRRDSWQRLPSGTTKVAKRIKKSARPSSVDMKNTRKSLADKVESRQGEILDLAQNNGNNASSSHESFKSCKPANALSVLKKLSKTSLSKPIVQSPLGDVEMPRSSCSRKPDVLDRKRPDSHGVTRLSEDTAPPLPPRNRQHRAPTKQKSSRKPTKELKPPAVHGDARVTKFKKATKRSAVPSSHPMRTRARGPADALQLT